MCLGIAVLTLPPSVVCVGYMTWFQGSEFCLEQLKFQHTISTSTSKVNSLRPPQQSFVTHVIGSITVFGTYYVQSSLFPYLESPEARDQLKQHTLLPSQQQQQTKNAYSSSAATTTTTTAPKIMSSYQQSFTKIVHQSQTGYKPPESMMEVMYNVTPPLAIRIGATSVAFFCAGFIQTYAAYLME